MHTEFPPIELLVFVCGVCVFSALCAAVSGTTILTSLVSSLSVVVLLVAYAWTTGISVLDGLTSTLGTYSMLAGAYSMLGALSCCVGCAFLVPENYRVPIRQQAREDRLLGSGFVVLGVLIWVASYFHYFLLPSCELTEWTRWSQCSSKEMMRRTRSVVHAAGYFGKPCEPTSETSWCSVDFDV
jgi:hypothetical protein